jgi:heavy metal sensor kinase
MRFGPKYVRDRLTIWYGGVFAVMLAAYICVAILLQFWQLTRQLYRAEIEDMVTVEGLLYLSPQGELRLHDEYINSAQSRQVLDRLMEVRTPDGKIVFLNSNLRGQTMGGGPFPGEGLMSFNGRWFRLADGTQVYLISHLHKINEQTYLIRLGYSTDAIKRRVMGSLDILLLLLPFALLVSIFAGYRFARTALHPLETMAQQADQITASRLHDRLPVKNPEDELGHVAIVFNRLLQRLEESFEQLKQFTSDVSHELRTPLASMRSVGEVGLQRSLTPEGYRQVIASMLEEVDQLTNIVSTLLTISRAEAGQIELHQTEFSLGELLHDSLGIVGILAEEKQQHISTNIVFDAKIRGDRQFLRIAVLNILDNAIKYSPPGGAIRIFIKHAESKPGFVELSVEDEGPGIPEESRAKVFDRFYRVDKDRSREAGGAGLGLSIAQWAVESQSGYIGFRPSQGKGSIFYIQLPAV